MAAKTMPAQSSKRVHPASDDGGGGPQKIMKSTQADLLRDYNLSHVFTMRDADTQIDVSIDSFNTKSMDWYIPLTEILKNKDLKAACKRSKKKGKVMEIAQLRWEVGILGDLHPRQAAHDAANVPLSVAHSNSLLGESSTHSGNFVSPFSLPPRGRTTLWRYARQILPVLAISNHPKLWEKVAALLMFLYTDKVHAEESFESDTASRESLYSWGLFYFAFIGEKADFKSMADLLKTTHYVQAGFDGASALGNILPEAMINLLGASSPSAFTKVFCDGKYSPQVIWSPEMRKYLHAQCAAHMKDYVEALEEDGSRPRNNWSQLKRMLSRRLVLRIQVSWLT